MDVLHRLASGLGEPCGYISLGGGLAHEIVGLAMVSRVLGIEQDVGTDLSDITNRHAVVGLGLRFQARLVKLIKRCQTLIHVTIAIG